MIKFRGEDNGKPLVGIGLSRKNCERLLAGDPIKFNLREVGLPLDIEVLVFAGETEQSMYEQFKARGLVDPENTHILKAPEHVSSQKRVNKSN
jgi:hypothetical protein